MTIRERVMVKPGGVIELHRPELPVGTEAEVTIVVEGSGASSEGSGAAERPIWEVIVELGASVPEEDWAAVPEDLSKNLDHYLYGVPSLGRQQPPPVASLRPGSTT